jgi:hypothetical protein
VLEETLSHYSLLNCLSRNSHICCPIAVRHRTIKCALAYSVQGIYSCGTGRRVELSFLTAVPSFLASDCTTGQGRPC